MEGREANLHKKDISRLKEARGVLGKFKTRVVAHSVALQKRFSWLKAWHVAVVFCGSVAYVFRDFLKEKLLTIPTHVTQMHSQGNMSVLDRLFNATIYSVEAIGCAVGAKMFIPPNCPLPRRNLALAWFKALVKVISFQSRWKIREDLIKDLKLDEITIEFAERPSFEKQWELFLEGYVPGIRHEVKHYSDYKGGHFPMMELYQKFCTFLMMLNP
jgi:hypothetical protein